MIEEEKYVTYKVDAENTLFQSGWRPAIGWAFVVIILFDFVIAPGLTFAFIKGGFLVSPWRPLTIDAAGFFYLCMGAVLGITSYSRGQEKIKKLDMESK